MMTSDGGAKNDNFHEIQIIQSLRSNNVLVGIIGVGPQCENLREFTLAQSLCLIYKKISQLDLQRVLDLKLISHKN